MASAWLSAAAFAQSGHVLYTFLGDALNDEPGGAVSGAGDVNRDGWPDPIVGAWQLESRAPTKPGYARVLSDRDGKTLWTFVGDSPLDAFDVPVSSAGDLNKDGYAGLIVGANRDSDKSGFGGLGYDPVTVGGGGSEHPVVGEQMNARPGG